jgi:hypothetical protein
MLLTLSIFYFISESSAKASHPQKVKSSGHVLIMVETHALNKPTVETWRMVVAKKQ